MKTVLLSIIGFLLTGAATMVPAADRIEMDDTAIVGTRELPKVLYIVPWKSTRLGTFAGVSESGSFEDGLVALDREVMQREAEYYDVLYGGADKVGK
jgi:hypothetical protein